MKFAAIKEIVEECVKAKQFDKAMKVASSVQLRASPSLGDVVINRLVRFKSKLFPL